MNRTVRALRRECRPDRLWIWVIVVLLTLGVTLAVADVIPKAQRFVVGLRASWAQNAEEDD